MRSQHHPRQNDGHGSRNTRTVAAQLFARGLYLFAIGPGSKLASCGSECRSVRIPHQRVVSLAGRSFGMHQRDCAVANRVERITGAQTSYETSVRPLPLGYGSDLPGNRYLGGQVLLAGMDGRVRICGRTRRSSKQFAPIDYRYRACRDGLVNSGSFNHDRSPLVSIGTCSPF